MTPPIEITEETFSRIGKIYSRISANDQRGMAMGLHAPGSQDNRARALDYFTNAAARMGMGTQSVAEGAEYTLNRLSYDYWLLITLYRNHWISRKIVDVPAQDMVRAWPRLTSDIEPDDLSRIDRAIRKTQTKSNILKTLKWSRLFGGAGALIVIDGHENRLEEPLDLETIELGAYRGVIPFDRWSGITPSGSVSSDITNPVHFNLPEFYDVQASGGAGRYRVHASRILRFNGPTVPAPEYEAQQYWGISSLEPAYEEIRKRDNMSWNLLSMSFRANIISIKNPELAAMLSGLGMNQAGLVQYEQRMQAMNHLLSNQSLVLLGKEGELNSVNNTASGWGDLYQQFQLDISGASTIPVTRLFGRTLSGLGQSNDGDERIYEEMIALEQDDQMRPQLDILYPVICMSELGEVPKDLDLLFPSIRVPNEKEKSDLAKANSDSVVAVFNAGIINKVQALKELKQSSDVTGLFTNVTNEDIQSAEDEEALGFGSGDEPDLPPVEPDEPVAETGAAKDAIGHLNVEFAGIPVTVEYQAGTRRTLKNADGDVVYDKLLRFDYGFARNTVGRDGEEIDVILGPNERSDVAYIGDMQDLGPDVEQRQDESKVLLGFDSSEAARKAFLSMYPPTFLRSLTAVPLDVFKDQIMKTGKEPDSWSGRIRRVLLGR